jgi:hypothetical protein
MLNSKIYKTENVKSRFVSGRTLNKIWAAILIINCQLSIVNSSAQSLTPTVVASSGGFFSNASGMLSETVGELAAVTTLTSANNFLTQGFQQPSDFSTSVLTNVTSDFSLSVFPNPSEGIFNVVVHSTKDETLQLTVYDMLGKKIFQFEDFLSAGKNILRFDMTQRIAGIYLLECLFTNPVSGKQNRTHIKLNLSY